MTDKEGSAFPQMTLRDYFAGEALTGAIQDYDRKTRGPVDTQDNVLPWATSAIGTREEIIARQAYRYADAMLKTRGARPVGEWQPIETCPRDGTDILLFFPSKDGGPAWMEVIPYNDCGELIISDVEPTHWMLLPEPPA